MEKHLNTIKELVEQLLEKMTVGVEIEITERGDYIYFVIKTREASILIG